jgi:intermediate cleaving peptidase 55
MKISFPHHLRHVPVDDRWPGMRIEDSIRVKDNNPYVLTTEAVKEVVDIEALRGR